MTPVPCSPADLPRPHPPFKLLLHVLKRSISSFFLGTGITRESQIASKPFLNVILVLFLWYPTHSV